MSISGCDDVRDGGRLQLVLTESVPDSLPARSTLKTPRHYLGIMVWSVVVGIL